MADYAFRPRSLRYTNKSADLPAALHRPPQQNSDFQKFCLTAIPNQQYIGFVSSLHEGRIAIVTDVGWDAVDADVAIDERDRGVR
jgi:hypothetical protein